MKKTIALLLAVFMLLGLSACGGTAPVETPPVTTEPEVQVTGEPTEPSTEEPTEAPTEPRVAPVDFEAVDPAMLPKPIPVEEQLLSGDAQTVTLDNLQEYEDLLWSLGFAEVRLDGTHSVKANSEAYCEPISLTYNDQAFRFDFTYCMTDSAGATEKEEAWCMYGTKSTSLENVSAVSDEAYTKIKMTIIDFSGMDVSGAGEYVPSQGGDLSGVDWSSVINNGEAKQDTSKTTPNYEEEFMSFLANDNQSRFVYVKAVYYPVTGNLYNYMCDPNSAGQETTNISITPGGGYLGESAGTTNVGLSAREMCFHYLFPDAEAVE